MSEQLTLEIPLHNRENTPLNESHLIEYKDAFRGDCLEVLKRLVAGEHLTQRGAILSFLSGDLRARIRDLHNPDYGLGLPISDTWVKTESGRGYKEYYMTDEDKIGALNKLINKLKKK
jgi:hypothetical protein